MKNALLLAIAGLALVALARTDEGSKLLKRVWKTLGGTADEADEAVNKMSDDFQEPVGPGF